MRWTGGPSDTIAANGFFVVSSSGFTGHSDGMFVPATGTLAATGGGIGLFDPMGHRVDSVGYGTATNSLVEGSPAPAPMPDQSIARSPDGHDTNSNSADFHTAATPTPGAANR
jgi:hypothetical protein